MFSYNTMRQRKRVDDLKAAVQPNGPEIKAALQQLIKCIALDLKSNKTKLQKHYESVQDTKSSSLGYMNYHDRGGEEFR